MLFSVSKFLESWLNFNIYIYIYIYIYQNEESVMRSQSSGIICSHDEHDFIHTCNSITCQVNASIIIIGARK